MQSYIETSIFNVNGDSLPGPLIIGTFEKRAPGPVIRIPQEKLSKIPDS